MECPRYYEIGPKNELKAGSHDPLKDGKFHANKSVLVTVQSLSTNNYFRYVFDIFDFRFSEDGDRATFILPFSFPFRFKGQVNFGITMTDDPFATDAAGMGSLGYAFVKKFLMDGAFVVTQDQTFIQGFVMHHKTALTFPER